MDWSSGKTYKLGGWDKHWRENKEWHAQYSSGPSVLDVQHNSTPCLYTCKLTLHFCKRNPWEAKLRTKDGTKWCQNFENWKERRKKEQKRALNGLAGLTKANKHGWTVSIFSWPAALELLQWIGLKQSSWLVTFRDLFYVTVIEGEQEYAGLLFNRNYTRLLHNYLSTTFIYCLEDLLTLLTGL